MDIFLECDDEEFSCPSGLHCVNTSSVCDGRKHCAAHEDEIGCGKVQLRFFSYAKRQTHKTYKGPTSFFFIYIDNYQSF